MLTTIKHEGHEDREEKIYYDIRRAKYGLLNLIDLVCTIKTLKSLIGCLS